MDLTSEVQFSAASGTTYWIQAGGLGGDTGTLTLGRHAGGGDRNADGDADAEPVADTDGDAIAHGHARAVADGHA